MQDKVGRNNTFERRAENVLAGIKRSEMKSGGRILLGNNTGGEAVMLRRINFQCVGA